MSNERQPQYSEDQEWLDLGNVVMKVTIIDLLLIAVILGVITLVLRLNVGDLLGL